jgi:hypothetical protein
MQQQQMALGDVKGRSECLAVEKRGLKRRKAGSQPRAGIPDQACACGVSSAPNLAHPCPIHATSIWGSVPLVRTNTAGN